MLDFRNFVEVLYTDAAAMLMTGFYTAFLKPSSFLDEPSCWGRLDDKSKAAIDISLKYDSHRHFRVELLSAIVKFLAECHHINTERTQSLTDLWRRLCIASETIDANCCLKCRACIHF